MTAPTLDRREFLSVVATVGGGFALGLTLPQPAIAAGDATATATRFSPFLTIEPTGVVIITGPQSEMGQGIHDGLPKMLAEELCADWATVEIRLPTGDDAFLHPVTKRHRTAGSDSTTTYGELMRRTGAAAREMLIAAAAARWGVPADACIAEGSMVTHAASARRAHYGGLAAAAAALPVPAAPRLKSPSEFTLIGRATPRKDSSAKVTGRARFGIDVRMPDMLYAVLFRPPTVAGRVVAYDRDALLRAPGVVDAVTIDDGIAVLARTTWHAMRAAADLAVHPATVVDVSAALAVNSESMRRRLHAALEDDARALPARAPAGLAYDLAATRSAIATAPVQHEWTYEVPFVAHAALEPLCATALVDESGATLWAPTQQPDRTRDVMAQVTGLPRDRCALQVTFLGGSFGRKWETDFVRQAMQIAQARPGRAVKLTWTREQDFRHDRFRPAHVARSRVGLDRDGRIVGLHTRITGISMWRYQNRPPMPGVGDPFITGGLISDRYAWPTSCADYVETPEPIPVGTWRSVSASMNGFFSESTVDDIADATRRDPLALRLELAAADPRSVEVLRKAAEIVGWQSGDTTSAARTSRDGSRQRTDGRGRGISLATGFGTRCAMIVEVEVSGRRVSIRRIVAVVDCGLAIDPRNVEAQISGGIVWGLSAAIDGRITFADGAAREANFHTAPVSRMSATPPIEVHLLPSDAPSGGVGEVSVPGVAPALASAIAQATGRRPRRLPLIEEGHEFI
ncbi:MAG: molybdopterin cofactor-binding domain-containing protein [Gammaproteobacteria bacterium]